MARCKKIIELLMQGSDSRAEQRRNKRSDLTDLLEVLVSNDWSIQRVWVYYAGGMDGGVVWLVTEVPILDCLENSIEVGVRVIASDANIANAIEKALKAKQLARKVSP